MASARRSLLGLPTSAWMAALALLAPALGALPGCSSEVRDFGSGGSGAGGAGGGAQGSGGSGQGGSGGGQGGSGAAGGGSIGDADCAPDDPSLEGPLCGPTPCSLLADEILPDMPAFRNDAPAIAVDAACSAHVAFSVAEGGFKGFYAHRDGAETWAVQSTPFEIALAGLAIASDGSPLVLANNGAFGSSLWSWTAEQWVSIEAVPGQATHWANGVALGPSDTLYAGLITSDYKLQLGAHAETWTLTPLGDSSTPVALSVSPDGAPHAVAWDSDQDGWKLFWYAPPAAPELAVPLGSSGLSSEGQMQRIAVTAPDASNPAGRPHVLVARNAPGGGFLSEIIYATRNGPSAWNIVPIDQEEPAAKECNYAPTMPGETCDYEHEQIYPLGIVAGPDGGVRMFYAKHRIQGTLVSECFEPMFCDWYPETDNSTGQLFAAWLGPSSQVETALVAEPILPHGATTAVDRVGRVHLAVYDSYPPSQGGFTVRYLMLGP